MSSSESCCSPTAAAQDKLDSNGRLLPIGRAPVIKWTRTGCITCKRRRKKCDELKPKCYTCQRLGLNCEGYNTLWVKSKPWRRRSNQQSDVCRRDSGCPLNRHVTIRAELELTEDRSDGRERTHWTDFDKEISTSDDAVSVESRSPVNWHSFESLPSPKLPMASGLQLCQPSGHLGAPCASSRSLYFLKYYLERLCPVLVMMDAPTNPLRMLLPPIALASSMLLQALCAVSACHMSQPTTSPSNRLSFDAVGSYTRALYEMNRSLSNCDDTGGGVSDEMILTIVFLCKYEIVKGSKRLWKQHLDGLKRLVKFQRKAGGKASNVTPFVKSFITYHSNIAKVTDMADPLIGSSVTLKQAGAIQLEDNPAESLDPYMGFTDSLLEAFETISAVSRQGASGDCDTELLQQNIENIKKKLAAWTCSSRSYVVPDGVSAKHLQRLELVAKAYRFAAYIYLYSIQRRASAEGFSYGQVDHPDSDPSCSGISSAMENTILQCLDVIDEIPCGDGCESSLVLPLFLAGCETDNAACVTRVIRKLMVMEQTIGLGNITRAREVVQKVWFSAAELSGKRPWHLVVQELNWDLILT